MSDDYEKDGEYYCGEYGHDVAPLDSRYGCRYCSKADNV